MYNKYFKSVFDFFLAIVVLIVLSPFFIIISLLLTITNRGDIFYSQFRPGLNGKIFKLVKFKTMIDEKNSEGELLLEDMRITKIGKILRKTSLDEIPQIINVIKGEMSFVGPRPLLPEYLPLYNDFQQRRHEVKPGITGWAQINGRNAITWHGKFKYDVWYVDNLSFLLDMKIILLTIKKVFKKEGISSRTSVTMERFLGNNKIN